MRHPSAFLKVGLILISGSLSAYGHADVLSKLGELKDKLVDLKKIPPTSLENAYTCSLSNPQAQVLFIKKPLKGTTPRVAVIIGQSPGGGTFVGFQDHADPNSEVVGYASDHDLLQATKLRNDHFQSLEIKENGDKAEYTLKFNGEFKKTMQEEIPSLARLLEKSKLGETLKLHKIYLEKKNGALVLTVTGRFKVRPPGEKMTLTLDKVKFTYDRNKNQVEKVQGWLMPGVSANIAWVCKPLHPTADPADAPVELQIHGALPETESSSGVTE